MSHFRLTTFLATTATAMTPFLAVWYFPQQQQKIQQSAAATLAGLPKSRPLAALREQQMMFKEKFGSEMQLL
jgi:hypothetical protein